MYLNETQTGTDPAPRRVMEAAPSCGSWQRRARRVPLGLALALLGAGASAFDAPDTMAERTRACTACHGKEGRATREGFFPRIAGKPGGYLYNQLVNFRDGRRQNPAMVYLVQHLSDRYLQEIAEYYA